MNPNVKALPTDYVMSQSEVAEKMDLCKNTVMNIEKKAMEKFRKGLAERGIRIEDLLEVK
jgi:DNA-directed RNA polymerase specialized sigma24 family protein|tara:strand:- start:3088 stop:3267 length:180 start_codon:yes stop_codon:yes gene_type:complete